MPREPCKPLKTRRVFSHRTTAAALQTAAPGTPAPEREREREKSFDYSRETEIKIKSDSTEACPMFSRVVRPREALLGRWIIRKHGVAASRRCSAAMFSVRSSTPRLGQDENLQGGHFIPPPVYCSGTKARSVVGFLKHQGIKGLWMFHACSERECEVVVKHTHTAGVDGTLRLATAVSSRCQPSPIEACAAITARSCRRSSRIACTAVPTCTLCTLFVSSFVNAQLRGRGKRNSPCRQRLRVYESTASRASASPHSLHVLVYGSGSQRAVSTCPHMKTIVPSPAAPPPKEPTIVGSPYRTDAVASWGAARCLFCFCYSPPSRSQKTPTSLATPRRCRRKG